tara:strand:+ start:816 stop:1343 length:528 start_codon:yes stop_codon:yes gene_type:complete
MSTLKVGTIQDHANSNTAINIDSSGRVLTPQRPAFSVHLNSTSFSSLDYTGLTDCPFDTIDFNIGNCVAISSNVATFTAPVTGIYHIHFTLSVSSAESSGHINSYLFVDNTANSTSTDFDYRHIEDPQGGTYNMAHSNALMQLNANQTVNPKLSINVDTSINVRRASRFWGYLIG